MDLMRAHGQLSVFVGVMIEQIIAPIPPLSSLWERGHPHPARTLDYDSAAQILWVIVLPGTLASTLGSYIGYLISFYGAEPWWFASSGSWVSIGNRSPIWKKIPWKTEALTIFLSRAIPVFPISLVSIFADFCAFPLDLLPFSPFWVRFFVFLSWVFRDGGSVTTYEKVATHLDSQETHDFDRAYDRDGGNLGLPVLPIEDESLI